MYDCNNFKENMCKVICHRINAITCSLRERKRLGRTVATTQKTTSAHRAKSLCRNREQERYLRSRVCVCVFVKMTLYHQTNRVRPIPLPAHTQTHTPHTHTCRAGVKWRYNVVYERISAVCECVFISHYESKLEIGALEASKRVRQRSRKYTLTHTHIYKLTYE